MNGTDTEKALDKVYDFIANSSDGVFAVDAVQTIVLWNAAAHEILGYAPLEVLGSPCYSVVRGTDGDGCAVCRRNCAAFEIAARRELPPANDLRLRCKNGDRIWVSLSTVVVPSCKRELSVLIHLFREIGRQHRLAELMRDLAEVVAGLSDAKRVTPASEARASETYIHLTRREKDVLELLVTGLGTNVIADKLCISNRTVRNHVNNILGKLGVHSRLEAVTYSIRNGLV